MNTGNLEIIVKALVFDNKESYTVDLTNILSDRAFEEITELIENKLTRRTA